MGLMIFRRPHPGFPSIFPMIFLGFGINHPGSRWFPNDRNQPGKSAAKKIKPHLMCFNHLWWTWHPKKIQAIFFFQSHFLRLFFGWIFYGFDPMGWNSPLNSPPFGRNIFGTHFFQAHQVSLRKQDLFTSFSTNQKPNSFVFHRWSWEKSST